MAYSVYSSAPVNTGEYKDKLLRFFHIGSREPRVRFRF